MRTPAAAAVIAILLAAILVAGTLPDPAAALEQRGEVSYLRGPYNIAFFHRHNASYRIGAAMHFAHGKAHDLLQLTPFRDCYLVDPAFNAEAVACLFKPPKTEPDMEYFAPYTAQTMWQLFRAIDWTHMLHEQTYDIMSDKGVPWEKKKEWTDRAVRYYLKEFDLPLSPAPIEVTMRRAAVMMKPYFTLFRNYYPLSNDFFYVAHWWHPAVYEAMMLGGNGASQDMMVEQVDQTTVTDVLRERPRVMLLSREMMPRYARLSPEAANIFDNLHMLHGIAYDILAYDGWTVEEKRAEVYRVVKAISCQPGDEELARKFAEPRADVDPRLYAPWMREGGGEMGRIMEEMLAEMLPEMMPAGMTMPAQRREKVMAQLRLKLAPGIQEGELPGSLLDALNALMPDMKKMSPEATAPGQTPARMVEVMLRGWQANHANMPDIPPIGMEREPPPPPQLEEKRYKGLKTP
jgi:hypothetical protein